MNLTERIITKTHDFTRVVRDSFGHYVTLSMIWAIMGVVVHGGYHYPVIQGVEASNISIKRYGWVTGPG